MSSSYNDCSPELREIISPIPSVYNSAIVPALILFISILVVAGFIIDMPEQIVADVRVTSNFQPITLKAPSQGKLNILLPSIPGQCEAGEYIAMIENSADPNMVRSLKILLDTVSANNISIDMLSFFEKHVQLGEIEPFYFKLREAIIQLENIKNNSKFQYEIELYTQKLYGDSIYLKHLVTVLNNSIKQFEIKHNAFVKDSILFNNKALLESEYDNSLMALLISEKQIISNKTDIHSKMQSIRDTKIHLNELCQEFDVLLKDAQREVHESFHNLKTQIKKWETAYIFMSNSNGVVDFYNFISDASYVQVGEPVFDIVFPNSRYVGIASLNAEGAGKIRKGQQVNIKLLTYPFQDYGTLDGVVERVSLNAIEDKYLLYITLPNNLISTTGQQLSFAETMSGEAEIITEKKSIIERLYSQFFTILHSKKHEITSITHE